MDTARSTKAAETRAMSPLGNHETPKRGSEQAFGPIDSVSATAIVGGPAVV
jgi:hypothetical protein